MKKGRIFVSAILLALGAKLLLLANVAPKDVHGPAYYVLLKGWIWIFGNTDVALRSMSLLFGLLAMWQIWRFTGRKYGSVAANLAVVFVAMSTTYVHYFTEARMYSLVIFLSALSFNMLYDRLEKKSEGWLIYSLVLVSLPFTHYFAGMVPLIHALIWWRENGLKTAWREYLPIFMGMLPIGIYFLMQKMRITTMWLSHPTLISWVSSIAFGLSDVMGNFVWVDILNFWFIVAVIVAIGWFALKKKDKWVTTDFAILVFPQLAGLLIGAIYPAYHHRYFLATLWFLPVLLAAAIVFMLKIEHFWRTKALAMLLLVVSFGVLVDNLMVKQEDTELRNAMEFVQAYGWKGDIVHENPFTLVPAQYYLRDMAVRNILFTRIDPKRLPSIGGDVIPSQNIIWNESGLPDRFLYYEVKGELAVSSLSMNSSKVLRDFDGLIVWEVSR